MVIQNDCYGMERNVLNVTILHLWHAEGYGMFATVLWIQQNIVHC